MRCTQCNEFTVNAKFCSRSCAATFNNKKYPKVKRKYKCLTCDVPTCSRRKYCDGCKNYKTPVNWHSKIYNKLGKTDEESIEEYLHKIETHNRILFKSSIGHAARRHYKKSNKCKSCFNCGYSKHYEVCHIKPICEYQKSNIDITTDEINHLDNLIALCRNCHWEFDHKIISMEEILLNYTYRMK